MTIIDIYDNYPKNRKRHVRDVKDYMIGGTTFTNNKFKRLVESDRILK